MRHLHDIKATPPKLTLADFVYRPRWQTPTYRPPTYRALVEAEYERYRQLIRDMDFRLTLLDVNGEFR